MPQAAVTTGVSLSWVQKHIRISSKQHPRIKSDDKLQFFHHLTTLFAAGTPLLEALRIASRQSQSLKMQTVIRTISERVAGGASLHQAAMDFPRVFDRQWVEVIRTGEISGQLGQVLTALTEHILATRELRGKIVSALIYPCILMCVAVIAIVVMLWKVVPVFADFFTDFDKQLPVITQKVIGISEFLQTNGIKLVIGVVVFIAALRYYLRTEGGKRLLDQVVLTLPLVGECAVFVNMEKFATNTVLLLRSGLPLLETLVSLQGVFHNNTVYRDAFVRVQQRVAGGGGLAAALEESRLFTSMVISMVKVGEESGEMTQVLEQVASYYRDKVRKVVERITSGIEPVVILGMGVSVAVILTSIYLPMFQMASGPG